MTLYEWECKNCFTTWQPRIYITELGEKLDLRSTKEDMEKYEFVSCKETDWEVIVTVKRR